jgi:hypothetical protein
MSQATVVGFYKGRVCENTIYALIKNGNLYRLNTLVPAEKRREICLRIKESGSRIQLKHWTLAKAKADVSLAKRLAKRCVA